MPKVSRSPILSFDTAVCAEILAPRTDIEPFAVVRDDAANFAAFSDPLRQNRNVGNVAGRNSLENGAAPDCDAGKIVVASAPVAVGHVDDAVPLERHISAVLGFAQSNRDIV